MFNNFLFNEAMFNQSAAFENILYSVVEEVGANLKVYFRYNLNINAGIDDLNSDVNSHLSGSLLISRVDEPSGNIKINYKYKFDLNAAVDDINSTIEITPQSSILDLSQDEVLFTISGADTIFGMPSNESRSLGGKVSWSRVESYLPMRLFPLSNLEINYISGTHSEEIIDVNLEIDDVAGNYTLCYKAEGDSEYGPKIIVDFHKDLKLLNESGSKYIYIKLNEAPLIEKSELVQLKSIYNNELILEEFNKNDPKDIFGSFFIVNSTEHTLKNIKLYKENNAKIDTEFGVEIAENREIQLIPDIYTEPSDIDWYDYSSSGDASVLIDSLVPGDVIGVWTKNYLIDSSSSAVSPWEPIKLNIEYYKGEEGPFEDSISTLTRIYDNALNGKLKLYYNINDNLDGTGTSFHILDGTGDLPYELATIGDLNDGDKIYYDLVKVNKYGIESIKNPDNFIIYNSDNSGSLDGPPVEPENGNILYDQNSNLLINAQYFPENEADIRNRAYSWDLEVYKIEDTSGNILIDDSRTMDATSGFRRDLENLNYVVDSSSFNILDGTPIIFKIYTKNNTLRSLNPYILEREHFNRDSVITPGEVNAFYGRNFGINRGFIANKNEIININEDIKYIIEDNKVIIKYMDDQIIKVLYRGESNIRNVFYLRNDYSLVEDDALLTPATTTDIFDKFEVESNILYFLVDLNRSMALDFVNKTLYVKSMENESDINLNDKYKNEVIFKRYGESIFNIFDIKDQKFKPFAQLTLDGDLKNNFKFENFKNNLENIV